MADQMWQMGHKAPESGRGFYPLSPSRVGISPRFTLLEITSGLPQSRLFISDISWAASLNAWPPPRRWFMTAFSLFWDGRRADSDQPAPYVDTMYLLCSARPPKEAIVRH